MTTPSRDPKRGGPDKSRLLNRIQVAVIVPYYYTRVVLVLMTVVFFRSIFQGKVRRSELSSMQKRELEEPQVGQAYALHRMRQSMVQLLPQETLWFGVPSLA
jgi:hypothetical protein